MNEVVDAGTPAIEEKFVVKKWPVIVCMLVNMVLFALPWFWYQKEAAINDAYGRENLDSFNFIPEFAAGMYLPLLVGIPLSLLYLICMKRVKKKWKLVLIALAPFLPWVLVKVLLTVATLGVFLILLLPCTILDAAIVGYALLNMQLFSFCCWERPKKKLSVALLIVGYVAVFTVGTMMALPMAGRDWM